MARLGDRARPVLEAGPGLRPGGAAAAPPRGPAATKSFLVFALLAADLAGVFAGVLPGVFAGDLAVFGVVLAEGWEP